MYRSTYIYIYIFTCETISTKSRLACASFHRLSPWRTKKTVLIGEMF